MQIFPLGLVLVGLWVAACWRSGDNGARLVVAALPFGMFAVVRLGGFSLLASDFLVLASLGLACCTVLMARPNRWPVPNPFIPLALLVAYATATAIVNVRVFQGSVHVFSFVALNDGERVHPQFSGTLMPLFPTSANISQLVYLGLAAGFFLLVADVARRRGVNFLVAGLRWAAVVNIILAVMDGVGLDGLLQLVRTADYALLEGLTVAGVPRIIGGFAEASAFGAFSAPLAAFMLSYGIQRRDGRDVWLGVLSVFVALCSMSSTAFLGLAVLGLIGLIRLPFGLLDLKFSPVVSFAVLLSGAVGLAGAALAFALTELGPNLAGVIDHLLFSKVDSASAMERSTMTLQGMRVFMDTYGLGAGIGATMANGYGPAILANLGIPGLVLTVWFFWSAFFAGTQTKPDTEGVALSNAGQVFLGVQLTVAMASSFSVSPGLFAVYMAAVVWAARRGFLQDTGTAAATQPIKPGRVVLHP